MKKKVILEIENQQNKNNDVLKAGLMWRLARTFKIENIQIEDIKEEIKINNQKGGNEDDTRNTN